MHQKSSYNLRPPNQNWIVRFTPKISASKQWNSVFYITTKKSCSKAILPVPGFYEWYTALVESDPRLCWSDRRLRTTSPPWNEESTGQEKREYQLDQCVSSSSWLDLNCLTGSSSYSRALLISSAALSMRALRMAERGMETCSEMDERGGLSLSAAEQDMGHNSRHRDTIESTTTWTQLTQTHIIFLLSLDIFPQSIELLIQ